MTGKYGQPYRIELRDEAGTIYAYEPMMSPLVQSRLNQLDMFDAPEIVGLP